MDKADINSKIDITKTYTKSDMEPFDLDVDVVSNRVIVESSDGSTRDIGQYTAIVGNQISDAYIKSETGEIVVEMTNGLPDLVSPVVKRDFDVKFVSDNDGVYVGEYDISPEKEWRDATSSDPVRIVDGESIYRYIIPIRNFKSSPSDINNIYIDSPNNYTHDDIIFFGNEHFDGIKVTASSSSDSNPKTLIDRDDTTNYTFNSLDTEHYIIYEFPTTFEISGIVYKNSSLVDAIESFTVETSSDGIIWDSYINVQPSDFNSDILSRIQKVGNNRVVKFVKLSANAIIGKGGIGNFDIISDKLRPQITITLKHKPLDFDKNFYNFENKVTSYEVGIKSNEDLAKSINPYVDGFMNWQNYARFELRLPSSLFLPATQNGLVNYNYDAVNNAGIERNAGTFNIPAGIYKIKTSLSAYRALYHYIYITDSDLNILAKGNITYGSNLSGSSNAISAIDQIIKVENDTVIRVNHFTQSGSYRLEGFTSSSENPFNIFSSLEIWKLMDIPTVDQDANDPHWENVTLLLNGEDGWSDQSKFMAPIVNNAADNNGINLVDYPLGKAYEFIGDNRYLVTLDANEYNGSIRYLSPNCNNITVEFFMEAKSSTEQVQYILGSTGFQSSPHLTSSFDGISIYIENSNELVFQILDSRSRVAINLNKLYYTVFSISNNTLRIFLDGELKQSVPLSNTDLNVNVKRLIIGSSIRSNSDMNPAHPFTGILGNIRITSGVDRYQNIVDNIPVPTGIINKYYDN